MKVILRQDIDGVGAAGAIVKVKLGYARNFLMPKGLAVVADENQLKKLDHERRQIEKKLVRDRSGAEARAQEIKGVSVQIARQVGEEEKLFGSVTAIDIHEQLKAKGVDIDRRRVLLKEPIKALGTFPVEIKLHRDVIATINVEVHAAE